ncbi:Ras GTPase, partial [Podila verticillata]
MDLYIPSSVLHNDKHSVVHNTPYSSSVPQQGARHRFSKHTSYTGNYHLAEQEEKFDQPNSEDEAEEREYQQAKKERAMAKQLKTEAKERQRDEKKTRKIMDKEAKLQRQKSRRRSVVRMSYQSNTTTINNSITDTNGFNPEKVAPILTLGSSEQDQIMELNEPEMDKRQKKPEHDRANKPKGYFQQMWAKIRHRRSLQSSKKGKQVQDYWGTEKKSSESATATTAVTQVEGTKSNTISPPLHKSDSRNTNASTTTGTMTNRSIRNSLQTSHRNSSLFEQETTRTWRGLFAAVRQLSHSASTTGSSHMSSSSSSATSISSSLSVSAQPPRLPHLLLAEPLHTLSLERPRSPPLPLARGASVHHGHKRQGSTLPPRHFQHRRQRSANARKVSIVLIGDGAVGKSAMALRFLRDQFLDEYDPTIEDSYCKHVEVDGQEYTLEITDTAGQEEYRGQWNETFMKSSSACATRSGRPRSQQVPMIVAANKCDLEAEREVSVEAGQAFATESHAFYAETSAKTGFNIQEMVVEL